MADRESYPAGNSSSPGVITVDIILTFNGTTVDPTITRGAGWLASAARTADGKFTLTLRDTFRALLGASVLLKGASAGTAPVGFLPPTLDSETVSSTKTLVLMTWKLDASATPAATAAIPAANEVAYITLRLLNSSAT